MLTFHYFQVAPPAQNDRLDLVAGHRVVLVNIIFVQKDLSLRNETFPTQILSGSRSRSGSRASNASGSTQRSRRSRSGI